MITGPNFRDFAAGKPISAGTLNKLIDWVQRLSRLSVESPLELHDDGTGPKIRLADAGAAATWFRVTTAVTAGSSPGYGSGEGVRQYDNGAALADDGATAEPLKNVNEKSLKVGAYAICVKVSGSWWVAVPDKCANLI